MHKSVYKPFFPEKHYYTHRMECSAPFPAPPESFVLPVTHVHEAVVGSSNPAAHKADLLTSFLLIGHSSSAFSLSGVSHTY